MSIRADVTQMRQYAATLQAELNDWKSKLHGTGTISVRVAAMDDGHIGPIGAVCIGISEGTAPATTPEVVASDAAIGGAMRVLHSHGLLPVANLVLLCGQHHKVIDDQSGIYTADAIHEMKAIHEYVASQPEQQTDGFYAKILLNALRQVDITNNSGNIAINSPGVIQAHTVTVKTNRKTVSVAPPPGTIGADQEQSRYVDYLIKRYNEFASKDNNRPTKFNFGVLSKNIESQFGGPWKLLSAAIFDNVCHYLQGRISKTQIAKWNLSRGYRAFSTYDEFLAKHPSRQ